MWSFFVALVGVVLLLSIYASYDPTGSDETLQELEDRAREFVAHLHQNHPEDPRVRRLEHTFPTTRFKGLSGWTGDVGYSIDKGKVLAVCTRDGPTNEAVFVILHELAHIATDEWGHTPAFWENFAFLLDEAEAYGWYEAVDYAESPGSICGTSIEHRPEPSPPEKKI